MIKLKKSLGQNFLKDKNIINKIINLDSIRGKNIFEIGPGDGSLTDVIIKKEPKHLIIVEKDQRLSESLNKKLLPNKKIQIFNKDILKFDIEKEILNNSVIFGNLPYNISTQILVKLIKFKNWPPKFNKLILMFQKEVADKILAKVNTKNYGRLTVITNWRLKVINHFNISRKCFLPVPKVDSTILIFEPVYTKSINIKDPFNLEKITHIFFSSKRKMVNKAFSKLFKEYILVAQKLNIDLSMRPSQIKENDYYKIVEYFENLNK